MSEKLVLSEKRDGVATIILNRPEKLNAISVALESELKAVLQDAFDDDDIRALILTGNGRAFSVGVDLKEAGDADRFQRDLSGQTSLPHIVRSGGKPIIAAVNGFAVTGGFELALMCDFLIASTQAKFADTHSRVGVVPGWGLSQILPRLIGVNRAREMSFTATYIDAQQALDWGLVNHVVEPEALLPLAQSMASEICQADPVALPQIKKMIDTGWATTFGEGIAFEDKEAAAYNSAVKGTTISERREAIRSRGRSIS